MRKILRGYRYGNWKTRMSILFLLLLIVFGGYCIIATCLYQSSLWIFGAIVSFLISMLCYKSFRVVALDERQTGKLEAKGTKKEDITKEQLKHYFRVYKVNSKHYPIMIDYWEKHNRY